jgi:hypothetical protein
MKLKTLVAVAVAAAFALPLSTQAQSDKPSSGTAKDVPAKCAPLTGADREKCLREEGGAGAGGSGGSTTSPSTSPTSPSTSGSAAPKKQ